MSEAPPNWNPNDRSSGDSRDDLRDDSRDDLRDDLRDGLRDDALDDWDEGRLFSRRERIPDAEMDITPMIDITFLLLIFFVVCSTLDKKTPIELAHAKHGKGVGERTSLIITVGSGGVESAPVYLADAAEGDALPSNLDEQRAMIEAEVEKAKTTQEKEDVLIKADRHVAHREVARVIKAVSRVEGIKIHLAVLEED